MVIRSALGRIPTTARCLLAGWLHRTPIWRCMSVSGQGSDSVSQVNLNRRLAVELRQFLSSNPKLPITLRPEVMADFVRDLSSSVDDMTELEKLSDTEELRSMVEAELKQIDKKILLQLQRASDLLLSERSFDASNARLEVHAGAGGGEACIFASQIFEMYCKYVSFLGFEISSIETETPTGVNVGLLKAAASIQGTNVFATLKYECGVHRVQRVPLTGSKNDRLQTSTCSVAVVPEMLDDEQLNEPIAENLLKYEFCRSSGAGGQSVNRTDSACRLTHLPSGITVRCEEERSQTLNKRQALKKLRMELFRRKFEQEMAVINKSRKNQIGNMDRNEKIRTYNFVRNTMTEHRLGQSRQLSPMDHFFRGTMGFEVLLDFRQALRFKESYQKLQHIISSSRS